MNGHRNGRTQDNTLVRVKCTYVMGRQEKRVVILALTNCMMQVDNRTIIKIPSGKLIEMSAGLLGNWTMYE